MMEKDKTEFYKNITLLLKRKWLWIIPMIVLTIGATIYAITKQDVYEARCVLILEKSKMIKDVLTERDSRSGEGKLLQAVSERMLGWESVVNVIKTLGLDREMPEDNLGGLERIYHSIVKNITLTTEGKDNDLIKISYRGVNPELNFRIVDSLVSNFMEQSIISSQTEADETIAFIVEDIKRLKRNLDESETKLRKFEEEHLGELPGGENNKLSKLSAAESKLKEVDRGIMALHEEISFLEDRKKEESKALKGNGIQVSTMKMSDLNTRIINLEIEIDMLRARYFDTHPAIVLRQKELASLKERLEIESEKVVTGEGTLVYNPRRYESLVQKEIDLQLELESLKSHRKEMGSMIASLSESVKNMPDYKMEFYELQRNYNLNKQLYGQRVLQRSKAELVKNMSLDAKSNPFTVVEPARISNAPVKSVKLKTISFGVFMGLGLGIALIFGLEQIDQRFKSMDEVQEYLQIPALGMIPTILTKMDIKRKIRKRIILSGILAAFVIAATTVCFVVEPVKDTVSSNVVDGWNKTNELIKGKGD